MKSMVRIISALIMLQLLMGLPGCSDDDKIVNQQKPDPGDGPATIANRIERTNEFALDLYGFLASGDRNLIISPHSIITCCAMAYAGARGNTERQMADVLHFNYPQAGFHTVLKQLNDALVSRPWVDLRIANGCWGSDSFVYTAAFLDTLSASYGADIDYLDFAGQPEQSRQTINDWVKQHTALYIDELLPPGVIDAATYLVLANAVFFIADWLHQFDPTYTYPSQFTRLDGSTVTASYMNGEEVMQYHEGNGYRAMEMPYKGENLSMVLILPDEGQYQSFEDNFSTSVFDSVVSSLRNTHITFMIPKFGFYSGFDLKSTLVSLGMTDAFSPGANFTGMDGVDDGVPWIDWVGHKAYIAINEYGTLAFAGTGMELMIGIHDHFGAVRPFIFVIRDIPTGTILFMGRVLDPSAS